MADFILTEIEDILILAQQSHVPECLDGLERPLTQEDFTIYKQTSEDTLITILHSLKEKVRQKSCNEIINITSIGKDNKLSIVHLLILCGEHSALDYWSSNTTVEITNQIIEHLLHLFHKNSVEEFILDNNYFFLKKAIFILRPKLLSTSWKCNPAAVLCYYWLLMKVKAPFLNDHLSDILPTALLITDDFEVSNRIRGLRCINHIVNNVTKADLEIYGQNDVILEALRPILYHHEIDILEPLLICIVSLMRKMNLPLHCNDLKRNRYDEVVDIILNNFDLEETNKIKAIYLTYLPDVISILHMRTLRHSRKLLDMLARELNIETDENIKVLLLCWILL